MKTMTADCGGGEGNPQRTGRNIVDELMEKKMSESDATNCQHILTTMNNYGEAVHLDVLESDLKNRGYSMEHHGLWCYVRSLETFGFVEYIPEMLKYKITEKGKIG